MTRAKKNEPQRTQRARRKVTEKDGKDDLTADDADGRRRGSCKQGRDATTEARRHRGALEFREILDDLFIGRN
jgi:hypothetical protein